MSRTARPHISTIGDDVIQDIVNHWAIKMKTFTETTLLDKVLRNIVYNIAVDSEANRVQGIAGIVRGVIANLLSQNKATQVGDELCMTPQKRCRKAKVVVEASVANG